MGAVWKFGRPHTIIGSVVSVVSLYIMLCTERQHYLSELLITVCAAVLNNIFIVGINQISDVEIDRINKPWLPIPSGMLNLSEARLITVFSLMLSLILALYLSRPFFYIMLISAFIGWAYSVPPFFLKQHHIPAALAICFVRGILVNVGGFVVFQNIVNSNAVMTTDIKLLTVFISVFAVVIAWFKDLPDTEGDAAYNIRTLAVVYSQKTVYVTGNILMTLMYLIVIWFNYHSVGPEKHRANVILLGHILLLVLFMLNSLSLKLQNKQALKLFYKRFWVFFFAEYLLYMIAYF